MIDGGRIFITNKKATFHGGLGLDNPRCLTDVRIGETGARYNMALVIIVPDLSGVYNTPNL